MHSNIQYRDDQTRSQTRSTPSSNIEQRKEDEEDQFPQISRKQVNFGITTRSTSNSNLIEDSATRSTLESTQSEDTVILQTTEEEDLEFPDELNNLITDIFPIDSEIKQRKKVYLNNDWQITDIISNPDFIGLIDNNLNMDLLSYITEELPF